MNNDAGEGGAGGQRMVNMGEHMFCPILRTIKLHHRGDHVHIMHMIMWWHHQLRSSQTSAAMYRRSDAFPVCYAQVSKCRKWSAQAQLPALFNGNCAHVRPFACASTSSTLQSFCPCSVCVLQRSKLLTTHRGAHMLHVRRQFGRHNSKQQQLQQ